MKTKELGFFRYGGPPIGWFIKTGEIYTTPTGAWMLQLFNYHTNKFDFYRYNSAKELHTCLEPLLLLHGDTYRVKNV